MDRAAEFGLASADIHYDLGLIHRDLGQNAAAVACLTRAIDMDASHIAALRERGRLLRTTDQPERAAEDLSVVASQVPASVEAQCELAEAYSQAGGYYDALLAFDRALTIDPARAETYYRRGLVLQGLDRPMQALEDYASAAAFGGESADLHCSRGACNFSLQRYADALADYGRALQLNPGRADAHYNRGLLYLRLRSLEEALSEFSAAIELDPSDLAAHSNRGEVCYRLGQYDDASANFSVVIEMRPDFAQAYYNRGRALQKMKQLPQAKEDFLKALDIEPDYLLAHRELGVLLTNAGLYDQALPHLERSRPLDDPTVDQYLELVHRGLQPVAPARRAAHSRR
jgi:tetratricopeptide (TPR) repeat protein